MAPRARVSSQFSASPKARNWASATEDLSSVFVTEKTQEAAASPADPQLSSAAQSGSESGEGSARLLDFTAASTAPCFASALTNNNKYLHSNWS